MNDFLAPFFNQSVRGFRQRVTCRIGCRIGVDIFRNSQQLAQLSERGTNANFLSIAHAKSFGWP